MVRPEIVDRVLEGEVVLALPVAAEPPGDGEIAGGDDALATLGLGAAGHQVAGDLLAEELIVGQVAVERANDPVAIPVRLRHGIVRGVAARVGVAHHIEPVPAPALAVAGRSQQAIHDLFEGLRRRVGEKRVHLGRRRRQAGEVEVTRRNSVRLSAGGAGRMPAASSRARMK